MTALIDPLTTAGVSLAAGTDVDMMFTFASRVFSGFSHADASLRSP